MSAWAVLFEWPTGSVWGNWVDDVICLAIGFVAGHWGLRWVRAHVTRELGAFEERLHTKLDAHHANVMSAVGQPIRTDDGDTLAP